MPDALLIGVEELENPGTRSLAAVLRQDIEGLNCGSLAVWAASILYTKKAGPTPAVRVDPALVLVD
jgi:hypothetical protein